VNIYQRINEVRKAVEYVRKEKKVESYLAVTHDQVTALVRDHFVKHGIVFIPTITRSAVKETGTTTKNNTPFIRFEASYRFDVVNMDDPSDKFSMEIEAHALDHGDKAPGKALSYAKKYAVLKLLEIESGEQDEDRPEQKPAPAPTGAIPANAGAGEHLTGKQKSLIRDTATLVIDALAEDRDVDAFGYCESIQDTDEKVFLWSLLDSKQRRRLKEQAERSKAKPS
jgi:hypothetical protein